MTDQYRFARSEVRPAERQLLVDGVPAALGARAFDLLVALIERRERVVDKAELFDTVWPGLVVEENNLQVQVSSLRKLLGPNAIATIPGRGYQFVAALAPNAANGGTADREPATNPHNLPRPRTRFIGREKALDDCASLLRDTRLLTLSGIGGCGKTRLAQELAHRQLNAFPDGVWFVDLGPLQEAHRVSTTVAATLRLKDSADAPLARVAEHLRSRRTLMVLDNCEHVIDAAVESIEALLQNCSALKIVATSREALGMAGEQIFAVRSLSLPATTDLEEIRRSEAVHLFVDHARMVLPEFAIDESNAAAVTEICRRLDGIALAIELAAARMRVLSVGEIRARLVDRFRLLTGGQRAMPRHQTLHATMQWSHDLLTAREQRLFRRLSVFAGSCTLAAAADVTGDGGDEYDTLERLTALHDKSLLVVDRDTQARPRYRMLETVRQYAEERLNEAGESDDVRHRHLLHYVALAARAAPELTGSRQGEWYAALRHEQENLMAAHAWCAHAPEGGQHALRLAASLWRFWHGTSQHTSGARLAQNALDLAGGAPDSSERGQVLLALSHFSMRLGRYEAVISFAEQSLVSGRAAWDASLIADALCAAGSGFHLSGQRDRALATLEASYDAARAARDERSKSTALNAIAEIHRADGNLAVAETYYNRAVAAARLQHDAYRLAVMLCNLACVLIATGQLDRARSAFCEAVALMRDLGDAGAVCLTLDIAAALAAASVSHAMAARFHGAALARLRDTEMRLAPVDEAFIAGWMERVREAMGAVAYDAAASAGGALAYDAVLSEMDLWLRSSVVGADQDPSPNSSETGPDPGLKPNASRSTTASRARAT